MRCQGQPPVQGIELQRRTLGIERQASIAAERPDALQTSSLFVMRRTPQPGKAILESHSNELLEQQNSTRLRLHPTFLPTDGHEGEDVGVTPLGQLGDPALAAGNTFALYLCINSLSCFIFPGNAFSYALDSSKRAFSERYCHVSGQQSGGLVVSALLRARCPPENSS